MRAVRGTLLANWWTERPSGAADLPPDLVSAAAEGAALLEPATCDARAGDLAAGNSEDGLAPALRAALPGGCPVQLWTHAA